MNLLVGRLSHQYGRKHVLIVGWIVAIPMPFMILYASNWNWIIGSTLLLGINQGLCWSMALTNFLVMLPLLLLA
ncbi:hypothetical protein [Candidatus Ruthturnera calyptogenae]|uniref:hypothetical protein n=1 Tax=Candidatus Ruthturnera calyptogenae TaxID=386487 RepID=UPI00269AD757